jgi:hypothetical protein
MQTAHRIQPLHEHSFTSVDCEGRNEAVPILFPEDHAAKRALTLKSYRRAQTISKFTSCGHSLRRMGHIRHIEARVKRPNLRIPEGAGQMPSTAPRTRDTARNGSPLRYEMERLWESAGRSSAISHTVLRNEVKDAMDELYGVPSARHLTISKTLDNV